jgi:hypothetical protein
MPDFTSANVLAAAGLSDLIGPRADFAFRKIIDDHEVLAVAERLSRQAFIIAALQSMDLGQLSRLAKRVRPEPAPSVGWLLSTPDQNLSANSFYIIARRGTEELFFKPKSIEEAAQIRQWGESVPTHILQSYDALLAAPNPEYVLELARAERARIKDKQDQTRKLWPGLG